MQAILGAELPIAAGIRTTSTARRTRTRCQFRSPRRRHDWMLLKDVGENASAWVEARDRRRGIAGGGGRRRWVRGRVAVPGASAGSRSWWRGEFLGIREAGREVSVAEAVLCECAAALLRNELQGAHRKIRNFGVRMKTTFTHERSPRRFASRRSRS